MAPHEETIAELNSAEGLYFIVLKVFWDLNIEMNEKDIIALAGRHGLNISGEITFNEIGLDFRVAFTTDDEGVPWVLRIPRRAEMFSQIEHEAKILEVVRRRLQILVPDWKIVSPELVAYPMLPNAPALSSDPMTHAVSWNIDPQSKNYIVSLARTLVDLHGIPRSEAAEAGLNFVSPPEVKKKIAEDIRRAKRELGMSAALEHRLQEWLNKDGLWPNFSVLIHGDLYAGHILAKKDGQVTGIIDWSEAEVSDPSLDFAGHLAVFGEQSLEELIEEYEKAGGRTWPDMFEQVKERNFASVLKFAIFALDNEQDEYITAAKAQLQSR